MECFYTPIIMISTQSTLHAWLQAFVEVHLLVLPEGLLEIAQAVMCAEARWLCKEPRAR